MGLVMRGTYLELPTGFEWSPISSVLPSLLTCEVMMEYRVNTNETDSFRMLPIKRCAICLELGIEYNNECT